MSLDTYFLQSERLRFRVWCKDDLIYAIGLWGDPKVTKLFDNRGKLTKKQVEEKLSSEIQNQNKYSVQYWPIFERHSHKHVGAAGLKPKDLSKRQYEIGFHICSKFWRQGFGSEAASAVVNYAFNEIKASSLFAGHNPKNIASEQLLKKLRFEYAHDEFYEPTGLMHPSYILSSENYKNIQQNA